MKINVKSFREILKILIFILVIVGVAAAVLIGIKLSDNLWEAKKNKADAENPGETGFFSGEAAATADPNSCSEDIVDETPFETPNASAAADATEVPLSDISDSCPEEPFVSKTPTPAAAKTPGISLTPAATTVPVTAAPEATGSGSLYGESYVDKYLGDREFLNNVSARPFADCGATSGDWYCGKFSRNEDGTVTVSWDKSKSTLATLKKYNGFDRGDMTSKKVYLTFTAGYYTTEIDKILNVLKEKKATAAFFVLGNYFCNGEYDSLLKRIHNDGHVLGSHGYYHDEMQYAQTAERICQSMVLTKSYLENLIGGDYKCEYYRPPSGSTCERDLAIAARLGLRTVFWTYTYNDYDDRTMPSHDSALTILENNAVFSGSVIYMHATSYLSSSIIGELIDYIRSIGYEIGDIREL